MVQCVIIGRQSFKFVYRVLNLCTVCGDTVVMNFYCLIET